MNKHNIVVLIICVVSLFSCTKKRETTPYFPTTNPTANSVSLISEPVDTVPRTSITFILGKDNYQYNQYYTLANSMLAQH